ncbi:preprotein translocase subunit SecA [Stratiformator vulcanicus]|nr:hypothetical protein [Stratiformator vulcanicus]
MLDFIRRTSDAVCLTAAGRIARRAKSFAARASSWSADRLLEESRELKAEATAGAPSASLIVPAFGLVCEASRRVTGLSHRRPQFVGGAELAKGRILEMDTGEGKTLTALLPTYVFALTGKGCHVVTANDYLSSRDAEHARKIFELLGLTVGFLEPDSEFDDRKAAYLCDVTFGTEKEFGFDYLRDQLRIADARAKGIRPEVVQRGQHFAILDEADSILIDQARTPLVIAVPRAEQRRDDRLARWAWAAACELDPQADFENSNRSREVRLTRNGLSKVVSRVKPTALEELRFERLVRQVESSVEARRHVERDRDYVVLDGRIEIIDESTGRILTGRRWRNGLHQAIEVKERLDPSPDDGTAAEITVQSYFRKYEFLAGLTGTARDVAGEIRLVFNRDVVRVPPFLPCQRKRHPTIVTRTIAEKFTAIVRETARVSEAGRSVLIGTGTVEDSERLSAEFERDGIAHELLHARHDAREAEIVAQAGQAGQITVATNMAGRGTDIRLAPQVKNAGGLHVIIATFHRSRRYDRQLVGRAARQGDPGSYRIILSREEIELARNKEPGLTVRRFANLQRALERRDRKSRAELLKSEETRFEAAEDLGLDPVLEWPTAA